jgi:hypothetical protein
MNYQATQTTWCTCRFLSKQTALVDSEAGLNHAGASDMSEIPAWRTFRVAAAAEDWLLE